MKKILILCTGNSCRSQMAATYLQTLDSTLMVRSAGTHPCESVNPFAVRVMAEDSIDISTNTTHDVAEYLNETWDAVITVCNHARETCPIFTGTVRYRLHIGFDDPAEAVGSDVEIMRTFRKVRDEIKKKMKEFYDFEIQKQ